MPFGFAARRQSRVFQLIKQMEGNIDKEIQINLSGRVLNIVSGDLRESIHSSIKEKAGGDEIDIKFSANAVNPTPTANFPNGFNYARYHELFSGRNYMRSAGARVLARMVKQFPDALATDGISLTEIAFAKSKFGSRVRSIIRRVGPKHLVIVWDTKLGLSKRK